MHVINELLYAVERYVLTFMYSKDHCSSKAQCMQKRKIKFMIKLRIVTHQEYDSIQNLASAVFYIGIKMVDFGHFLSDDWPSVKKVWTTLVNLDLVNP